MTSAPRKYAIPFISEIFRVLFRNLRNFISGREGLAILKVSQQIQYNFKEEAHKFPGFSFTRQM